MKGIRKLNFNREIYLPDRLLAESTSGTSNCGLFLAVNVAGNVNISQSTAPGKISRNKLGPYH